MPVFSGYVYFAQACDGAPVKIGSSMAPKRRVRSLSCPVTGARVSLINVVQGDIFVEFGLHERFAHLAIMQDTFVGPKRKPITARTEWFRSTPDLLSELRAMTSERAAQICANRPYASFRGMAPRLALES